jgi:hypothetical protein
MVNSINLTEKYRHLYNRIKAQVIEALEEARAPDATRREIIEIVSNLPHPKVASILDIMEVCRRCVSGKLEYLYKYFGDEARKILSDIEQYGHPPVPSERYELKDVVSMLTWTNRTLYDMSFLLHRIKGATDIIIKGQCPYCLEDLVTVIVGNELRLRCKGQTKPDCRKVDWYISDVSPRTPP